MGNDFEGVAATDIMVPVVVVMVVVGCRHCRSGGPGRLSVRARGRPGIFAAYMVRALSLFVHIGLHTSCTRTHFWL